MSNVWDIPELDPALAADHLVAPVTKWGTRPRTSHMPGTWHFYAWDYVFTHLQRYPDMVPATGCQVAVEPNYTVTPETPKAEAIWKVYLKRKLARSWQERGVRIIVDLNMELDHDFALAGVPVGWPAYATRKHKGVGFDLIEYCFDQAARHARGDVKLFVVFGGGRKTKRETLLRGWQWCAEHRQVVEGIESPYGER